MGGMEILLKQVFSSLGINPEELKGQLEEFLQNVGATLRRCDARLTEMERRQNAIDAKLDVILAHLETGETGNERHKPRKLIEQFTRPAGDGSPETDRANGTGDADTTASDADAGSDGAAAGVYTTPGTRPDGTTGPLTDPEFSAGSRNAAGAERRH